MPTGSNGSIVLVGTSAVGLRDYVSTPRSAAQPGVEVHAEIIDQILSGEFLTRPDWAPGAEIVVAALLTLLLLAGVLSVGPLLGAIAALIIIAAAIATSWFAFANWHSCSIRSCRASRCSASISSPPPCSCS